METIKLTPANVVEFSEIPHLIKNYQEQEYKPEGSYFRVKIEEFTSEEPNYGLAYSNQFTIYKKDGEKWNSCYCTGRVQYRSPYRYDTDNWDLSLSYPSILEESESEVVYALRTGAGNIKILKYDGGFNTTLLISFNMKDYQKKLAQNELAEKISSPTNFLHFVQLGLNSRWNSIYKFDYYGYGEFVAFDAEETCLKPHEVEEKAHTLILLCQRADRPYDAISDLYQIYVWIRGVGFGKGEVYKTRLRHPMSRIYHIKVNIKAKVKNQNLQIEVFNKSQDLSHHHEIRLN